MEAAEAEYETSDVLMYRTSVANFPVLVFYNFVDDALIIGNYSLEAKHSSNQAYLHDFWSLKDLLQTKYGESEQSQAYWVDELYKDNVDEWGMAVAAGHAAFFEHWTDGDTQIELQITGDNFEIRVAIIYRSAKLRGLYEKSQKQRALNDL
jgi:hypothetical protein